MNTSKNMTMMFYSRRKTLSYYFYKEKSERRRQYGGMLLEIYLRVQTMTPDWRCKDVSSVPEYSASFPHQMDADVHHCPRIFSVALDWWVTWQLAIGRHFNCHAIIIIVSFLCLYGKASIKKWFPTAVLPAQGARPTHPPTHPPGGYKYLGQAV